MVEKTNIFNRYLEKDIEKDIQKKMVFISGPRQVGKTTMAKSFIESKAGYLNWDIAEDREDIILGRLPLTDVWIFDELHKNKSWRQFLKGCYDSKSANQKIIVTGSARLDYYRYGGDSLQGRYFFWRLHPLSVAELGISDQNGFDELLLLGGFPEQYFSGSQRDSRRWSREYRSRLIQEDLISVETVKDLGKLELLMLRLPDCVGSPLSINSLREDLNVNHKTVDAWLTILERLYGIFRLLPFGAPTIRAVKKEQKHYHYDWTLIKEPGIRFENLVAVHLLKWVHYIQDSEGRDIELRYFRDVDKREVDFIIVEDNNPLVAIECKNSKGGIHPSLKYFSRKFHNCRCIQLLANCEKEYKDKEGIEVLSATNYLSTLI